MSDQVWAILAGGALVVAVRILDFFMPEGRAWKWMFDRTVKSDDDQEKGNQT